MTAKRKDKEMREKRDRRAVVAEEKKDKEREKE